MGMGSARASRAVFRALAEHDEDPREVNRSVRVNALGPTGEGAGRNTRRRVCSPQGTKPLWLGPFAPFPFSLSRLVR